MVEESRCRCHGSHKPLLGRGLLVGMKSGKSLRRKRARDAKHFEVAVTHVCGSCMLSVFVHRTVALCDLGLHSSVRPWNTRRVKLKLMSTSQLGCSAQAHFHMSGNNA